MAYAQAPRTNAYRQRQGWGRGAYAHAQHVNIYLPTYQTMELSILKSELRSLGV